MKRVLIASLLLCFSTFNHATAETVGTVILSFGQNAAVSNDGDSRVLKRKSEVFADDTLKTGIKGRLQIRFTDGSRLSLKPDTEFKITEYQFDSNKPNDGKAIYKLLKGGMRTITGKIGKTDREDYKLDAVIATIGIRGTDFTVIKTGDKVTGSVNSGKINVTSKLSGASKNINPGRSFEVSGTDGQIRESQTPQSDGSSEEGGTDEGDEESESTSDEESDSAENTSTDSDSSATEAGDDSSATVDASTTLSEGSLTDPATLPASDPATEGNQAAVVIAAPNPTGNGVLAPQGSIAAVAFTEDDPDSGLRASSGVVMANDSSALTIDSSTGKAVLTGLLYVDNNNLSSNDSCNPCTFASPSNLAAVDVDGAGGTLNKGGSQLSWGRWNNGYTLTENGTQTNTVGSFGYMFADKLTSSSELSAVSAARSGSYVYTFNSNGANAFTAPQIENGKTGNLINYDNGITPPAGRLYHGTYVVVNWDSQTIDQISIMANVNDGMGLRLYHLGEKFQAGTPVKTSLSTVLNGGQLKLEGSCSGGQCTVGATNSSVEGHMTFDLVGTNADAAVSAYGASGTSPSGTKVTVSGTVLLEDSGAAP